MSRRRSRWYVPVARFLAGRDLFGENRTDATFFHAGTDGQGGWLFQNPTWWTMAPGWRRLGIRIGLLAAPIGSLAFRTITEWVLGLAVSVLAGVWAARGWWAYQDWHITHTYVQPMHVALSTALNLPAGTRADEYISVPWNWAEKEARKTEEVTVILPADFDASKENEDRIGGLILRKLDLKPSEHTWATNTVGVPVMTIKFEPVPPELVSINDPEILAAIDAAGPSEIVLGRTAHGIYSTDFASESPHAGFSCESGTGKSSLLQVIAAQVVRKAIGNRVIGLDPKKASMAPVAGLPNVTIYTRAIGDQIKEMLAAVAGVRDEVIERGDQLDADPTIEFDALFLLIDEINFLAALINPWWERNRGQKDPKKCPFWSDLLIILAAGRQFRVHVVVVGQDLRESALGNIGLRTMIGLRGIAGYDRAMWVRFIQTMPIPRVPKGIGRWYFQVKGERALVQNAFGTPQEIVDLGRAGRPMSQVPVLSQVDAGGVPSRDTDPVQPEKALVIGLEAGAMYLGIKTETFRARRKRAGGIAGETKVGNQPAWTEEMLETLRIEQSTITEEISA